MDLNKFTVPWQFNFKLLLIFIAVVAVIVGGLFYVTGKPIKINKDLSLDGNVSSDLKEALYYASLAPSSHNAQNWKVIVHPAENKMFIEIDETRTLKQVDPDNREAYISVGAFLETLRQALSAYGYAVEITIMDNAPTIAEVHYGQIDSAVGMDNPILANIEKRHTNKRSFNTTLISQDVIDNISNEAGVDVSYLPKDSEHFTYIQNGTLEAYTQQANHPAKRDELAQWLRFSNQEAKAEKDGLPAEQLGIMGVKKVFYYLLVNREISKQDSFAKQGIDTTRSQLENCSGFFLITGDHDRKSLILSGMKLQFIWLKAAENNVAIQPMSQMLEEMPHKEEIQNRLGTIKPVQIILRAGYVSDYGINNKIRRPLQDFVEVIE